MSNRFMNFNCKPCVVCHEQSRLMISVDGYEAWRAGVHVQDAFPGLSSDIRELLISGTHSQCFNKLFPPDDDYVFRCDDLGCADVGIGIVHHPYCGMTYEDAERVPDSPEEEEMFPPDPARL